MFFVISKIVTYLFRPAIWLVILLALALFHKNPRKRRRSLWLGFMILLLFSNTFIVTKVTGLWAVEPKPVTQVFDVGVVLGGSTVTYEKKFNRTTFKGNIDRLLQAVELYNKGEIKKILITGASGNLIYPGLKEAKMLRSFLLNIGIPKRNILMDTLAENTHENAVYTKKILQQHPHIHSVLLFTSSMHMRRAMACFIHEGIKVQPYPTNLINSQTHWNIEYLLIPSISNFLIWDGMIHEIAGYGVYKIMGYI
ncbi:hypothetical protein MNBD_BACTEROID07-1165 [hydrothermal vent metagenome]|uniref:DUF218 domain-containing protein n=1 Tax=hydrothermal vent metagenome TaxID=652676 RepID=A0A3B0UJY2_9ZZZZ